MKSHAETSLPVKALRLFAVAIAVCGGVLCAQAPWEMAPSTTPDAQRNSLKAVQSQVSWLQNATRTAPNLGSAGADNLWQQFQAVRGAYNVFKGTLTPRQLDYGANELAELDAGLDIIQGAFNEYQDDLAAGRSVTTALNGLCRILQQTMGLWVQELNRSCGRLRVGFL